MATPVPGPAWLDLAGANNVRDLAGLPAGDQFVRSGVLLRGDHIDDLTAEDLVLLRDQVGLRAVIDLRSPRETPTAREWLTESKIAHLHIPLVDLSGTTEVEQLSVRFATSVAEAYEHMLRVAAPDLARILAFLVEPEHAPALIHCAAGKDRTGIAVAVLMAAAGVDEDAIVADYLATGQRLHLIAAALQRRPLYRDVRAGTRAGMSATAIRVVLDTVQGYDGGVEGFLLSNGATADQLRRWRELLLSAPLSEPSQVSEAPGTDATA